MSDGGLSPSGDAALGFLVLMFGAEAVDHLVAIPPDGSAKAKTFTASEHDRLVRWVDAHQGRDNLHFTVNRLREGVVDRKAKKADVEAARCLHVDVDDLGPLSRIQAFKPKPTATVFSSNGCRALCGLLKADNVDHEHDHLFRTFMEGDDG
jgi:hypothetical protein